MKKHPHYPTDEAVLRTVNTEGKRENHDQQREAGIHHHDDVITIEAKISGKRFHTHVKNDEIMDSTQNI